MDLELSDGEGVQEIKLPRGKRKEDGAAGNPSPAKQRVNEQEMVSMNALRAVLAEQTRDIKEGIKTDIQTAIQATERKFDEAWEGVRGDILQDLASALADVGMQDKLDAQAWVPAARHSVALAEMSLREGEDEAGMRSRMLAVVEAVNAAAIRTEHLKQDSKLWCAISRPRQDRGNGTHAGKVRKLLRLAGVSVQVVDCSYRAGTVWVHDQVVASVAKIRPPGEVLEGKIPGGWVDVNKLAEIIAQPKASLVKSWENITIMWGN